MNININQLFWSNIFVDVLQIIFILYLEATVLVQKAKKVLSKGTPQINMQTVMKQTW